MNKSNPAQIKDIKVSVIVPAFNNVKYTKNCLDSLLNTVLSVNTEIIIVNNGSSDETECYLNTLQNIIAIHLEQNMGFARACNIGSRAARGKYLVFLNNDTVALPQWLEEMVKTVDEDKKVGVVGSRLLYPNGTIQHAGVLIAGSDSDPLYAVHAFYKQPGNLPEARIPREYQAVTGACLLIKRDLFLKVGGFNEDFINGYEDIDLCFKVRQEGYRVVYCPTSVLYHHEAVSENRYDHVHHNVALLHRLWLGKIRPEVRFAGGKLKDIASIIIPCLNQVQYTRNCVRSILDHTPEPYELIFIDNGSDDGTGEFLRQLSKRYKNVVVITNVRNQGYGAACNQGIKAAAGRYIVLLNNDTLVTRGWLTRMLEAGRRFSDVGVIGPRSNAVSGSQRIMNVPYRTVMELQSFAGQRAAAYAGQGFNTNRLVGFCMLIKKEVIDKIGGYDLRFGPGNFEDDDICLRARIAGFKLWVCDDSFVHHYGSITFNGAGLDHSSLMKENWEKFRQKWGIPEKFSLETFDASVITRLPFDPGLHYCPLE